MTGQGQPPDRPPGSPEPEFVRRARYRREAWDLYFPMIVGVVSLALLVSIVLIPSLRDPTTLGVIGSALVGLAGLGLKRKP